MKERFESIRDTRFIKWNKKPHFLRRPSWMYPDDGCYARAALANRNIFRLFVPILNKIFVFGSLKVKTENSPKGYVTRWYHVAPIVEVEGNKYVLDSAIEPEYPLEITEWLKRMGKPEKFKVAICGSGTYSPSDNCEKETDGLELRAEKTQQHFLDEEWKRMLSLGRTTEAELGDRPPWF